MPRITKTNPITNYVSREELQRIDRSIAQATINQENAKLARIQIKDALETALEMFESNPELKEIDAAFPRGSVYGIVKAAVARIQEARL